MTLRSLIRVGSLFALAIAAASCDSACPDVNLPCPLPAAISVTVSSTTGAAISGAFVRELPSSDSIPCSAASGTTCLVHGGAGTYQLAVGAAGYQTVNRTVNVAGAGGCGCTGVQTQHLDVALAPTP